MTKRLSNRSSILLKISFIIVLWNGALNIALSQVISLKSKIDSNDILIGDWINYSLELTHSKDIEVLWPIYTDTTFGKFELVDQTVIDTNYNNNIITKKQNITLTSFDSGQHIIPALRFLYKKKKDTLVKSLITDTFIVNISTVEVDTSKAIKPIKAPLKAPITFRELIPYILIFFILIIIAFVAYYFIRKRRNKPILMKKEKPKLPAHVIALDKLKKIENEKLWQKGEIKKYHILITEIIREYIENRYSTPALESTTEEILNEIAKLDITNASKEKLKDFLELSDLVKFAKLKPRHDDNEICMKTAYEFINTTKIDIISAEKNV